MTVAVIDSGVDANHPDLRGQVLKGADFVDGTTDGRSDVVGHGTTVAALIAGRGDDSNGVIGLAYQAKILPVRVLDPQNEYDSADQVARAVRWAVDHGARVINMSLGSADAAPVLSDAVSYAFRHDVVVVACDGNLSNNRGTAVWHPARQPGVVAVAGVERTGMFWDGSLQGPETVLTAPSADITGAHPGGTYWRVNGTSFAAPLVTATAALIRSKYPKLSAATVISRLILTAWDFGPKGRDPEYGYGIVNPAKALTADVPATATNPLLAGPPANRGGQQTAPGSPDKPGPPTSVGTPQAGPERATDRFWPGVVYALLALSCVALVMFAVLIVVGLLLLRRRRTPAAPPLGSPVDRAGRSNTP